MANKQLSIAPRNLLLDAFEKESRKRVDPYLERVEFKLGDVICEAAASSTTLISPMVPSSLC